MVILPVIPCAAPVGFSEVTVGAEVTLTAAEAAIAVESSFA